MSIWRRGTNGREHWHYLYGCFVAEVKTGLFSSVELRTSRSWRDICCLYETEFGKRRYYSHTLPSTGRMFPFTVPNRSCSLK